MAKIVTPLVDVKAVDAVKWTSEKARKGFWHDLGSTATAAGVWATMATGAHGYAIKCRADNSLGEPNASEACDAYMAGRTVPGGPGALSPDSEKTYRSVIATLLDVFYRLPYDSKIVRDFAAKELGSVAYGTRASVLTAIAKAYPKAPPTTDEMNELIPDKIVNISDDFASIVSRLSNIAAVEANAGLIAKHNLGPHFKAVLAAAKTLAEASDKAIPVTPKKVRGKGLSAVSSALLS